MLIHLKRKQGASIFEVNRDKLGTIFATASRVICFFVIALTICGKLVDQVLLVGREIKTHVLHESNLEDYECSVPLVKR
jgi:hypothetical protein